MKCRPPIVILLWYPGAISPGNTHDDQQHTGTSLPSWKSNTPPWYQIPPPEALKKSTQVPYFRSQLALVSDRLPEQNLKKAPGCHALWATDVRHPSCHPSSWSLHMCRVPLKRTPSYDRRPYVGWPCCLCMYLCMYVGVRVHIITDTTMRMSETTFTQNQ